MPTTYAHYRFGQEVLRVLDNNMGETLRQNTDLYNLGLHGPDLLFYYKPLSSNKINKLGNEIHGLSGQIFFENARPALLSTNDLPKASAYIAGFICHYILDSQCHPYIRTKEDQVSHNEIEAEFDRFLMLEDRLDPIRYKPTGHIKADLENAKCISEFFSGTGPEEILESIKSMKLYLNLLTAANPLLRVLLIGGLKITGSRNKIDLIKKYRPNEACEEINRELIKLYEEALKTAPLLIEEYFSTLISGGKINERFKMNFG